MYNRNCPMCGTKMEYKSKSTLREATKHNTNCKICKCKVISEKLTGKILTEEHKNNISKKHKGKILSEEHKKNISVGGKGVKRSEESKKKYSLSKMGDKNPAKRQDVKDKIRNTVLKNYKQDPL